MNSGQFVEVSKLQNQRREQRNQHNWKLTIAHIVAKTGTKKISYEFESPVGLESDVVRFEISVYDEHVRHVVVQVFQRQGELHRTLQHRHL